MGSEASQRSRSGAGAPARFPPGGTALAVLLLFWGAFGVFSGLNTYLSMLTHGHSLVRIVVYQLVVCAYWAAATPLIAGLARRFPIVPLSWRGAGVHAAGASTLTTGYAAWATVMTLTIRPYDAMSITRFMPHFLEYLAVRLPVGVLVYVGTLAVVHAFGFHQRATERAMRAAQLERELSQARLDALAIQLQPHFLFNALHTVAGLIRANESQQAISTIAGLSDLLRYALDSSGTPVVALRDELEIVRRYLQIQELRYGHRLRVSLEVAPETLPAGVPRLLLQPLIENAIRHGVALGAGPAWLSLRTERVNGALRIEIRNSTPPGRRLEDGLGIGLRNTRARLAQLYGDAFEMDVGRLDDRFELSLDLPWRPVLDQEAATA